MYPILNYIEFKTNPEPYMVQGVVHGAPSPTRTGDLRIRSPTLYPSELWARDLALKIFWLASHEPYPNPEPNMV
jgi:hypothetical protein